VTKQAPTRRCRRSATNIVRNVRTIEQNIGVQAVAFSIFDDHGPRAVMVGVGDGIGPTWVGLGIFKGRPVRADMAGHPHGGFW
jgi:hypothetical protein